MTNNKKFLEYCLNNLDLNGSDNFEVYFSCVAICVINAIFSINTKYEAVINVINRFCNHFRIEIHSPIKGKIPLVNKQKTISEIYNLIKDIPSITLAEDIFKNKQRTSTKNGILKAEASLHFIKILKDFGVETYQDISKIYNNEEFKNQIKLIPGQRSEISLKYFFMLTGSTDQIKPDRMILGFIKDALGLKLLPDKALSLIQQTVNDLKKKGYKHLTARHLDNLIWNFQRSNNSKNKRQLVHRMKQTKYKHCYA